MGKLMNRFKKSLIWITAVAMTATTAAPVSAFAAENKTDSEIKVENHTFGRSEAEVVSGLTIGDVEAPKEGVLLDEKAVVTTAEKVTWEIPVIWIDQDLTPDTGLAGKGTYLPVLAFVVPQEYALKEDEAGKGCTIKLSEDLLKLYGDEKDRDIISIYNKTTGITYILPAKLKDLFAEKTKDGYPVDEGGSVIIPDGEAVPSEGDTDARQEETKKEEPQEEDKPQEETTGYSHLVDVHCDQNAKDALSVDDLEFLADLVINKLQPQAINLLISAFPALRDAVAADPQELGTNIALQITYNKNAEEYGYAQSAWNEQNKDYSYRFVVEANSLVDYDANNDPVVVRNTDSKNLITLANTIVHELFHVIMYDYNRPGMTGYLYDESLGTIGAFSKDIEFPVWFKEGTATSVENNWQERKDELEVLRTPFNSKTINPYYDKELFLNRYIDGKMIIYEDGTYESVYSYDLQTCGGIDLNGRNCDKVANSYVSGYLATIYLGELAAKYPKATVNGKPIGTSVTIDKNGAVTNISSGNIRYGLNYILERMHKGSTLDQVIKEISGGAYSSTDDFEARFIKGIKGNDGYEGDADSLDFVVNFANYMRKIDLTEGRSSSAANGSILFDFDLDFSSPLDFEKDDTAQALQVLDHNKYYEFCTSSVNDAFASSTGGKSLAGAQNSSSGSSISNTPDTASVEDGSVENTQIAAKEAEAADAAETAVTAVADETAETVVEADDVLTAADGSDEDTEVADTAVIASTDSSDENADAAGTAATASTDGSVVDADAALTDAADPADGSVVDADAADTAATASTDGSDEDADAAATNESAEAASTSEVDIPEETAPEESSDASKEASAENAAQE